jgi:hypothetical protein
MRIPGSLSSSAKSVSVDRTPTIIFAVCVLSAIPIYLILGSASWFIADEWEFISGRALDIHGIFSAHSGHWVTLPFLAFRGFYELVGLHTYRPYQLLSILSHVSIVVLNYVLMRRMGIQAWLATATTCALLTFGAGSFDIFRAFQVTINGSILCGLLFLLLADHEGPLDWRNVAGVGVAIVGLMTSATMVPMIIGAFTAILLQRGLALATLHIVPPISVFILWFFLYGTSQSESVGTLGQTLEMMARMTTEALFALGQSGVVAAILGIVIVLGLWRALRESVAGRTGTALALPAAFIVAWLGFSAAAALRAGNLSFDPNLPAAPRYLYVGGMLLLPLIGYGASQLAKIRSSLALVPVVALALGVPGNIKALVKYPDDRDYRNLVLAVAHSELIGQVPGNFSPLKQYYNDTTVAWLRLALAKGKIPDAVATEKAVQLSADALLALRRDRSARASCVPELDRLTVTAHANDIIKFGPGRILVALIDGDTRSRPFKFNWTMGQLVIQAGPVNLEAWAQGDNDSKICIDRRG